MLCSHLEVGLARVGDQDLQRQLGREVFERTIYGSKHVLLGLGHLHRPAEAHAEPLSPRVALPGVLGFGQAGAISAEDGFHTSEHQQPHGEQACEQDDAHDHKP